MRAKSLDERDPGPATVRRSPPRSDSSSVTPVTLASFAGHLAGERHRYLTDRPPDKVVNSFHCDEPGLPDEGDAITDALHLREHVRRKEHTLPRRPRRGHEVGELVLDERVEARGRLIEDEQLRPVHQRLDRPSYADYRRRVRRFGAPNRSRAAR